MTRKTLDIVISTEARTGEKKYEEIQVKDAFYTCGYKDGSSERMLGALNHSQTYVVDKNIFGTERDLLVRTGNARIGKAPEIFSITERAEKMGFAYFKVSSEGDFLAPSGNYKELLDKIEKKSGLQSSFYELFRIGEKMSTSRSGRPTDMLPDTHPIQTALGTLFIYGLAGKLDEGLKIIKKMK